MNGLMGRRRQTVNSSAGGAEGVSGDSVQEQMCEAHKSSTTTSGSLRAGSALTEGSREGQADGLGGRGQNGLRDRPGIGRRQ